MNSKKGLLVVLSAPSGCGKDTVFKAIEKLRDDVVESISATTRKPRPGEVDGVNYYFKTREEFEKMIDEIIIGPKSQQNIDVLQQYVISQGMCDLVNKISISECSLR